MTADPVVTLDTTATREDGIGKMLETLRANMAKAPEGSMEARIAAILMDVLPGFFRALDRERIRFTRDLLAERGWASRPARAPRLMPCSWSWSCR